MSDTKRATFIFDGDCGICSDTVRWLKRHGAGVSLEFASWQQQPGAMKWGELTEEDCRSAAFVVEPLGDDRYRVHRGAAAINYGLRSLRGPLRWFWTLVGSMYLLPGIRHVQDSGYGWVARNRHRLSRGDQVCEIG